MLLEIIATTCKEALDIEKAGADRIELVTGIKEGGLTPSIALIKTVCNNVSIPVNVMLRPHSKSFIYSKEDLKVVYSDIIEISKTRANGIVFGALNEDLTINFEVLKEVINLKGKLALTFHRALDATKDIDTEFDKLIKYNINTILTSGGKPTAVESIDKINSFVKKAKLENVNILAGSGLNLDNIKEFIENTIVEEIHFGSGVKYDRDNFKEIDLEAIRYIKNL